MRWQRKKEPVLTRHTSEDLVRDLPTLFVLSSESHEPPEPGGMKSVLPGMPLRPCPCFGSRRQRYAEMEHVSTRPQDLGVLTLQVNGTVSLLGKSVSFPTGTAAFSSSSLVVYQRSCKSLKSLRDPSFRTACILHATDPDAASASRLAFRRA
jgi:hypothetical protein